MSVFRQASPWERVLAVPSKSDFIIRTAPDDPDVVYVADKGAKTIYYSADAGQTRWQSRTCAEDVEDMAVETDGDVSYVLNSSGDVTKSTNGGFTWGSAKDTKLTTGNMIASVGEGNVLVGSDNGYVSYSTDSGSTWTKIEKQVGDSGSNVQTIASGLDSGDFIYAALEVADKNIYRWELGESTSWKTIYSDTDSFMFYGIALQDGVLYAQSANSSASKTFRTLNPTHSVLPTWSTVTLTSHTFNRAPQGLKVSSGPNKLWATDNLSTDVLYSFTDAVADTGVTLLAPPEGLTSEVNAITGRVNTVTFSWEKPADNVAEYQLKIYLDAAASKELQKTVTVASTGSTPSAVVGPESDNLLEYLSNTTYYWKVRVSDPVYSPYSEVRSFKTGEAEVTPPVTIEVPPAPQITFEVPPPPEELRT